MNRQQILWAAQHDWYSHCNGDAVYCMDSTTGELVSFNNFKALREWAGY